jgi:hypothetical protein
MSRGDVVELLKLADPCVAHVLLIDLEVDAAPRMAGLARAAIRNVTALDQTGVSEGSSAGSRTMAGARSNRHSGANSG